MWVKFMRSKDEALEFIIKCLNQIQVCLNATVRNVRTDNGTEFVDQTLKNYYKNVVILHQTFVGRTSQQNDVGERRNHTLLEVAHIIEDLGKLKPKADIGLVPNLIPQPPYVPPTNNNWYILFQPMFDDFFNPPLSVVSLVPVVAAPKPTDPTGLP
nr:putative RNA-directed DNA polymerase [Tanacetum cinerariifolium]